MGRIAWEPRDQPILVTGTHYSSTTLVGEILSRSAGIHYIHEPFNIENTLAHDRVVDSEWFYYIDEANEEHYVSRVQDLLYARDFVGKSLRKLVEIRKPKDPLRIAWYISHCAMRRFSNGRPLVKDPIALLSSRWLADRFDMRVVLMIRHPCAFVESVKRKNVHFPFANFLNQPRLMATWLRDHREEIEEFVRERKPLVEQATLLWFVLNQVALNYAKDDDRFLMVRHEDLVIDPQAAISRIAGHVGVPFDVRIKQGIADLMNPTNPVEPSAKSRKSYVRRDPRSSMTKWREALSTSEIDYVMAVTAGVYDKVYGDEKNASSLVDKS